MTRIIDAARPPLAPEAGGGRCAAQLADAAALLRDHRDVLESRVASPQEPAWSRSRGLGPFLAGLDDDGLALAEREGLAALVSARGDAPAPLVELCARLGALARAVAHAPGGWPARDAPAASADEAPGASPAASRGPSPDAGCLPSPHEAAPGPLRGASARKRAQVEALVSLARAELGHVARVVDVGAGKGHATRALAAALGVPCIGLERDGRLVDRARRLHAERARGDARFAVSVVAEAELRLERSDLVLGLHACGALGDAIVRAAASAQASTILVSCCPQKIPSDTRPPLSRAGRALDLSFARPLLGLSNLAHGHGGVEAPVARTMQARLHRHALRLLLQGRGLDVEPGAELAFVQRRRAMRGLSAIAGDALARRGLAPATEEERARCLAQATAEHGLIRRWSLPRNALGRLLELVLVLDRACHLEEAGHAVQVRAVFPPHASPRNLGIVART